MCIKPQKMTSPELFQCFHFKVKFIYRTSYDCDVFLIDKKKLELFVNRGRILPLP